MHRFLLGHLLCTFILWLSCGNLCSAQVVDSVSTALDLSEIEVVERTVDVNYQSSSLLQQVSREDIERLGYNTVSEVIKGMAGVQMHDYGGVGGLKTVSIRGLGAKHTAVNYDGVVVADAQSGLVDIGRFTTENVSVLSLSIGQGSDIFRSAKEYASAGVVNIATRKPLASTLSLKARIGDFGTIGGTLLREKVFNDVWSYSAFVNVQRVDGDYPFNLENGILSSERFRENGDVKSLTAEGNLFGDFGAGGNLSLKVYYFDSERGLPGAVNLYNRLSKERLWDDNFFVQSSYNLPLTDKLKLRSSVKYNYSFSRYRDENSSYFAGFREDRNTQHEYYATVGVNYDICKDVAVVLSSDLTHSVLRNNISSCGEPRRLNSQTVFATQYENDRFFATASLLATYIADRADDGNNPEDKKRLSPSFSLSWQPLRFFPLRLRASYKDVFRVPTFTDLYYLRMGNTSLRPERATQYNAGLVYSAEGADCSFSLSVDGYYNSVKDKIVALPTMYIWRMKNYGKVEMKGVDVTTSFSLHLPQDMELLFNAAYSYCHSVDKSDKEAKNYAHQIPYTPRHTGNGSLSFNNRWVNVSYMVTAVGVRYMLPQNIVDNEVASYVEHTLAANREFALGKWARLRLQGELLNFTDVNYDVIRYYPMPGRQWRFSACITF